MKDACELSLLCHVRHALDGVKKPARRFLTQGVLQMTACDLEGQMSLSSALRGSFGGQLCQILQPAFENIEWVQDPKPCSVSEGQDDRSAPDSLGREADDAAQKIDLLDPQPAAGAGQFCRV